MKTPTTLAILIGLATLSACVAVPDRYVVPAPSITEQQRIAFRSIEIREISLPSYAASDEISIQSSDGKLTSKGAMLWADAPERAISLELARNLTQLTGSRVASEPWPFEAFADARLELRFETLVARDSGEFRAAGQYFVAVQSGRERSGLFNLVVPFDPLGGPQAIATARGQIISDLAQFIASDGLG